MIRVFHTVGFISKGLSLYFLSLLRFEKVFDTMQELPADVLRRNYSEPKLRKLTPFAPDEQLEVFSAMSHTK